MISYRSTVSIARPPDVVFPYLVEPEKQALWSDVPMRRLTDGPIATGSRMEVTFAMGPVKARVGLEMTAVEAGSRMGFRTFSGPIAWEGEYRLTPRPDGGTDLEQEGSLRFSGLWRLIEPIAGGEIRSGEIKELEKIKTVVEAG